MSKTKAPPEQLGLLHYSCRESNLRCKLGVLQQNPGSVQIPGAPCLRIHAAIEGEVWRDSAKSHYPIFFVSEAPGATESKVGLPFVGDAGQLLQKLLRRAGIPLEDAWLCHIARCRPPKNRDPSGPEIKACLDHLYYEIRKYQPRVIILLGRIPLQLFKLQKGGIGKQRGQVFVKKLPFWEDGPEFIVVPTYHPASLLRRQDPKIESQVIGDLKTAIAALNAPEATSFSRPEKYPVKFKPCLTVEDVRSAVDEIKAHGKYALDTESLDLHLHTSTIITLQLSLGEGRTWVIPFSRHWADAPEGFKLRLQFNSEEHKEIVEILSEIFEDENFDIYATNFKYDANVIRRWLGLEIRGRVFDTAILHHQLVEDPPHGLEYLADLEFQVGDYSKDVHDIVGYGKELTHTFDHIPDEILWPYGATDAEMSYRLGELYLPQVKAKNYDLYESEGQPLIRCFQEAEWIGAKVNKPALDKAEVYYEDKLLEARRKCAELTDPEFNPNSPAQVAKYLILYGHGKDIVDEDKASGVSTGKEVLMEIKHPLAKVVLDVRTFTKRLSTYIRNIRNDSIFDGRVRYTFLITGTVGGRQSCKLLHQIPRITDIEDQDAVLREIFMDDDDYDLVYADFDQLELRVFAYLTGEQELIRALEDPDGDIHSTTAAAALGIAIERVSAFNRSGVGKPLGFGTIYGSRGGTIAKSIYEDPVTGERKEVGIVRAEAFVENFKNKYKKVKDFPLLVEEEALCDNGRVTSVFGRTRRVPDVLSSDKYKREAAIRELTNFKVQSPAASILNRTVVLMRQALHQHNVGTDRVRFLLSVHDSCVFGVRKDHTDWFSKSLRLIAERQIPEIGGKRFPVSLGVGRTWAAAELDSKKKK